MNSTDGFDIPLKGKRGAKLTYEQWKAGYLHFENKAGKFTNESGEDFPFPDDVNAGETYSAFLRANS